MMRPGLDKPGALPLLIVVIFSLLTLAPSLSSIYNLKLADFTYNLHGPRHTCAGIDLEIPESRSKGASSRLEATLISETITEFSSDTAPVDLSPSWITATQYRPRGNRLPRSLRSGNNAQPISGELAPVENKSRLSYNTAESSFMFSRRARAFRTYFIQQLDDYQIFTPFSNRSFSASTANLNPTPLTPPSNSLSQPTSLDEPSSEHTMHLHIETTSSSKPPTSWLRLQLSPLSGMWQQACHATNEILGTSPESGLTFVTESLKTRWNYLESLMLRDSEISNHTGSNSHAQDPHPARTNDTASGPTQVPKPTSLSHDETADAAVRTSPEIKGSCMAIVIGLVVGIMWF